jgi:hypothetical protein
MLQLKEELSPGIGNSRLETDLINLMETEKVGGTEPSQNGDIA